jgi:hypothetical protein
MSHTTHKDYCRLYYQNNRRDILAKKKKEYYERKYMEEDLFTAARRLLRNVNVDSQGGGLLSIDTEKAATMLQIQVDKEDKRRRAERPKEDRDDDKT